MALEYATGNVNNSTLRTRGTQIADYADDLVIIKKKIGIQTDESKMKIMKLEINEKQKK